MRDEAVDILRSKWATTLGRGRKRNQSLSKAGSVGWGSRLGWV